MSASCTPFILPYFYSVFEASLNKRFRAVNQHIFIKNFSIVIFTFVKKNKGGNIPPNKIYLRNHPSWPIVRCLLIHNKRGSHAPISNVNRPLKSFLSVFNGTPSTVRKTAVSFAGGFSPIIVFTNDATAACSFATEAR